MQMSPNLFPLPQEMLQSDLLNQPQPTEPNKSKRENKNMHFGAYGHFRNYYPDATLGINSSSFINLASWFSCICCKTISR